MGKRTAAAEGEEFDEEDIENGLSITSKRTSQKAVVEDATVILYCVLRKELLNPRSPINFECF
jgi:hypothetical protein